MAKENTPEPVKEAAPAEAPKEAKKPQEPAPKQEVKTDKPKEKKPEAPVHKPQKKPKEKKPEHSKDFKYIVRVSNTDLDGHKSIINSLRKISGVSFMFANAICQVAGVERTATTGELNDADIKKIQAVVESPSEAGFPTWMLNRRKDYETGTDKHLIINDLKFTKDNDLKRLKKIKSYRGMRHQAGLPSRGQRTKSNFRTNKGKKR